jgi:hypothetical protein
MGAIVGAISARVCRASNVARAVRDAQYFVCVAAGDAFAATRDDAVHASLLLLARCAVARCLLVHLPSFASPIVRS